MTRQKRSEVRSVRLLPSLNVVPALTPFRMEISPQVGPNLTMWYIHTAVLTEHPLDRPTPSTIDAEPVPAPRHGYVSWFVASRPCFWFMSAGWLYPRTGKRLGRYRDALQQYICVRISPLCLQYKPKTGGRATPGKHRQRTCRAIQDDVMRRLSSFVPSLEVEAVTTCALCVCVCGGFF